MCAPFDINGLSTSTHARLTLSGGVGVSTVSITAVLLKNSDWLKVFAGKAIATNSIIEYNVRMMNHS